MNIKPTKNRVLILTDEDLPPVRGDGIVLLDGHQDFPNRGTVLRVGPGCTELEEGDVVHFNPYAPQVRIPATNSRTLVLMRESNTTGDPVETVTVYEVE